MRQGVLNVTLKKASAGVPVQPEQESPSPLHIFKGPEATPFLAPRGVWMAGPLLIVADTGRNRVFVWRQFPPTQYAEPDVVLGQEDSSATGRNGGGLVHAASLQYPSGVWSDGQRLIVADAWNHRVLIWHTFPTKNGQPADTVLGQANFTTNQPNRQGVGTKPASNSLYWPYGVWANGSELWVADTGNRRILYFNTIPQQDSQPADAVFGQPDFFSRDYNSDFPVWPYSVKFDENGYMAIADTQYFRVMLWPDWRAALAGVPPILVGQSDLNGNGANQFGLTPQAHTLNWCYDTAFYNGTLWVADTGNSRILGYSPLPVIHNQPGQFLIGKPDFNTGSEFSETIFGTEGSLYWPFSLHAANGRLAVADTGNHRVILYPLPAFQSFSL